MEKIYALISLCFCVVSSLQAQTTIYAYRNWQQSNPVNVQKGPVKFSSDNLGVVELIADQSTLGGGKLINMPLCRAELITYLINPMQNL